MVRGAITRLASATGAMVVAAVLAIGVAPAAHAAPKPATKPTAIEIKGAKLPGNRIVVTQQGNARLFASLLSEVSWMASARSQTGAPPAASLGPKYTVTVFIKTTPTQVYELYPLAAGGPRAHRPAKQPTGRKSDAWFYGRLAMSETLRVSGVPLEAKPDVVAGGIGGGIGEKLEVDAIDPVAGVTDILGEMRQLFLLNGAVLMVILVGLAGIAFLIRRRV